MMELDKIVELSQALENSRQVSPLHPFYAQASAYLAARENDRRILKKYRGLFSLMAPEDACAFLFGFRPQSSVELLHYAEPITFILETADFQRLPRGLSAAHSAAAFLCYGKQLSCPELNYRVAAIHRQEILNKEHQEYLIRHEGWHNRLKMQMGWSGTDYAKQLTRKNIGAEGTPLVFNELERAFKEKAKEEIMCDILGGATPERCWENLQGYVNYYEYLFVGGRIVQGNWFDYLAEARPRLEREIPGEIASAHDFHRRQGQMPFIVSYIHTPFDALKTSLPALPSPFQKAGRSPQSLAVQS